MSSKKSLFCVCIYKIYLTSAEGYKDARVFFSKVQQMMKFGQAWKMLEVVRVLKTHLI